MFIVKLADYNIKIHNKYDFTEALCRNYIIDTDKIDLEVYVTDEEISEVRIACDDEFIEDCYESIAIYTKICNELLLKNCFFLHASVVEVDGVSYAFCAESGTGKSTHSMLWLKHFKDRARIINGDKPIVKIKDNKLIAYGTPWCGKEGFNINTSSPLKAICFINRSEKNSIRPATEDEKVERLIKQFELPKDKNQAIKLLEIADFLIKNMKFYVLNCNMEEEAAVVAYNGMNEE